MRIALRFLRTTANLFLTSKVLSVVYLEYHTFFYRIHVLYRHENLFETSWTGFNITVVAKLRVQIISVHAHSGLIIHV